jgi:anti-anti-sigma factor
MRDLQFETKQIRGIEVVSLSGSVEPMSFSDLAATLGRLIHETSPRVVLDCREVNYIGSVQLRELLDFAQYARTRGGDIKCVALAPAIRQVVSLISNGNRIDCFDELSEALAAFGDSWSLTPN